MGVGEEAQDPERCSDLKVAALKPEPGFPDFWSVPFPLHKVWLTKYPPPVASKVFAFFNAEDRSSDA